MIGDGSWGTTLAVYLAKAGHRVSLWGAFEENVTAMNEHRENRAFLPEVELPRTIEPTADLTTALNHGNIIVLGVPSQYLRGVLQQIADVRSQETIDFKTRSFLSIVKGIDPDDLLRMSQLIRKFLGPVKLGVLSGPTIAKELVKNIPSTAVIASRDEQLARDLQSVFNSDTFRIYTNDDVCGVELGGSLKNVIAIACGVADGLNLGTNTKSAILARGLAEMSRLGQTMGAKKQTFYGLTGLGDLATTCFSEHSRNRRVGELLGSGKSIKEILEHMSMVAEGVETVKAVVRLADQHGVDMPIAAEVYNLIYQKSSPRQALKALMTRKTRSE